MTNDPSKSPSSMPYIEQPDRELEPIYAGLIPATHTDPRCITCRGTGVTGPYGIAAPFQALMGRGETAGHYWSPCLPCSVSPAGPELPHRPGRGLRIVIVEQVTRGPAYGSDVHTHHRTIHLYVHDGLGWLWPHDTPSAIAHADWGRGPAGFVVGEIWPAALIQDSETAPADLGAASPMHSIMLTSDCKQDPCPLDPPGRTPRARL